MGIRREEEEVVKLPTERFCSTASRSGVVHVYKNDKKCKGSINIYNEENKVKMVLLNLNSKLSQENQRKYRFEDKFKQWDLQTKYKFNTEKKDILNWKEFFSKDAIELSEISSFNLSSSSLNKTLLLDFDIK